MTSDGEAPPIVTDDVAAPDQAFPLSITLNVIVWVPALSAEDENDAAVPIMPFMDDDHW